MGEHYAALYRAVQARLDSGQSYGRNGKHHMGACPECRVHVCLSHHDCPKTTVKGK